MVFRFPSVAKLVETFDIPPEDANKIRSILRKYHFTIALKRINDIAHTCGVEYLNSKNGRRTIAYLNTGDSYANTLCYNFVSGAYSIRSWSDWAESLKL